jgi:hypothetical protein
VKIGLVLCGSVLVTQFAVGEGPADGSAAVLPVLHTVPVRTAVAAEPVTVVLPTTRSQVDAREDHSGSDLSLEDATSQTRSSNRALHDPSTRVSILPRGFCGLA